MKIGHHQGFRTSMNGKLGYVFPTIVNNRDDSVLFIFDESSKGHDAPSYFLSHQEDWKSEYAFRCYWCSEKGVTIEKYKKQKKVIL